MIGILRLIRIILSTCDDKEGVPYKINNFLKWKCCLKALLVTFLETNLIFISFNCFLQLYSTSFYKSNDKFNSIISMTVLFISIIYTLTFYVFQYAKSPQFSESILTYSKFQIKGFICEMNINCIKNLVNGAIHALFLYRYNCQIILLTSTKVYLIVVVFLCRKVFRHVIYLFSVSSYLIFGIVLDIVLYLQSI